MYTIYMYVGLVQARPNNNNILVNTCKYYSFVLTDNANHFSACHCFLYWMCQTVVNWGNTP